MRIAGWYIRDDFYPLLLRELYEMYKVPLGDNKFHSDVSSKKEAKNEIKEQIVATLIEAFSDNLRASIDVILTKFADIYEPVEALSFAEDAISGGDED